jgi:hypothetical protein
MNENAIGLKVGETLQLDLAFANDDGSAVDLIASSVAAQVRDLGGNLVDTLPVLIWLDVPNVMEISAPTDEWPVGTLLCDIVVRDMGSGVVTYSDTLLLRMSGPISLGVAA